MNKDVVKKQFELLRFRNTNPAFGFEAKLDIKTEGKVMTFTWENVGNKATLVADFEDYSFEIK
jgi:sucrose phosphorylase